MDGEIIIKTALDSSEIDKGIKEIESKLKDLSGAVGGFGESTKDSVGVTKEELVGMLDEVAGKMAEFQAGLGEDALNRLGIAFDTVTDAVDRLGETNTRIAQELENGIGAKLEAATANAANGYDEAEESAEDYEEKLKKLKEQLENVRHSSGGAGKASKAFGGVLNSIGNIAKKAFNLFKGLIGFGALKAIFSRIKNLVLDSMQTMSKYDDTTKQNLQDMNNAFGQMRNALAAIFAPLGDLVIPIITRITSAITAALNRITMFTSALAGRKTAKIAKGYKDMAGAVEGVGEAAKQAKSYLTGLDEVQKANGGDSGGGGGGGGGESPFEEVAIDPATFEMVDKLRKKFEEIVAALEPARQAIEDMKEATKRWLEETNFGPLEDSLMGLLDTVAPLINSIFNLASKLFQNLMLPFLTVLVEHFLPPIIDFISRIIEFITELIADTAEWIDTTDFEPLMEALGKLGDSFGGVLESLSPIFDLVEWFYREILLPIAAWLVEEILPVIIDSLAEVLDGVSETINGITEVIQGFMNGDMEQVKEGLSKFAGGLWKILFAPIKAVLTIIWKTIKAVWENILVPIGNAIKGALSRLGQWFRDKWDSLKAWLLGILKKITDKIDEIFPGWRQVITAVVVGIYLKIKEIFTKVKNWLVEKWTSIKEKASEIFTGIKAKIVSVFLSLKNKMVEIFESLKEKLRTPLNAIISFLNGLISGAIGGINNLIGAINSLHIDVPDWVRELSGVESLGFNIPTIPVPQIPLLAQGAVIPPNKAFTAVLGDQKHGMNLEAPEDLIRQIVREESGKGSVTVQATANRKVLFEFMIDEGKRRQVQTGRNPFELA